MRIAVWQPSAKVQLLMQVTLYERHHQTIFDRFNFGHMDFATYSRFSDKLVEWDRVNARRLGGKLHVSGD